MLYVVIVDKRDVINVDRVWVSWVRLDWRCIVQNRRVWPIMEQIGNFVIIDGIKIRGVKIVNRLMCGRLVVPVVFVVVNVVIGEPFYN